MWEALSPSQSAVLNPIMLLTSTAGYADSVILRALYDRAMKIQRGELEPDPTFLFLWWMADDDDAGLDWDQLRKANPALVGGRLNQSKLKAEFEIMPRASWIRERLNRWSDERAEGPFSLAAWGECRLHEPLERTQVQSPRYVLAVNVNNNWTDATIAVAAKRRDGRIGVEIHAHLDGTSTQQITGGAVSGIVSAFAEKYRVAKVLYLHNDPIAAEAQRHKAMTGKPWEPVTSVEYLRFCNDFQEAVGSRRIAHDDPLLDGQIAYAARRFVGSEDAWRWAVTMSGGPITAVQAATLAAGEIGKELGAVQLFTPKILPQDAPKSESGTMSHPR
jgi:Phage terminase-like protein, large subunit